MTALACRDLWKRYRRQSSYGTLREVVAAVFSPRAQGRQRARTDEFWALREVDLTVRRGEALGIVGPNGSGKSTLLKIVAGVTRPTRGRVAVNGRVGALIEVGTGFHPELSGQENIYLYGAILGLPRREIRRKFDRIVEFAELDAFLGTPIKRYSSGMRVRLGFAVAAHLDPQILLVDEVLAVGDAAFQRKCIRYIRQLQEGGTTIVFVSHELPTVERLCQRVAWLDGGVIREVGPGGEIIAHYVDAVERTLVGEADALRGAGRELVVEQVTLSGADGRSRSTFAPGEPMTVDLHYRTARPGAVLVTLKIIDDQWSTMVMTQPSEDGLRLDGAGIIRCAFPSLPLFPKSYQVWIQILGLPDYRDEIPWQAAAAFSITGTRHQASAHPLDLHDWEVPVLQLPAQWSVAAHDPAGAARA